MKVAVAGWGGAGKTTVAGTLARTAGATGGNVLAIEEDPTPALPVTLGLDDGAEVSPLPQDLLRRVRSDGQETDFELAKPPGVVVEDYGTAAPAGVTLLKLAAIDHDTGDVLNSTRVTAREVLAGLLGERDGITVIDAVGVLEYLPGDAIEAVDVLIVVVEPYYKSLESGRRTIDLAHELGFSDVHLLANKVQNGEQRTAIREFYAECGHEIGTIVPYAEAIQRAREDDRAPIDAAPDSPSVQAICTATDDLLSRYDR